MKINIFGKGKGKDSPIYPILLDYASFLHFFSGLFGYIFFNQFLKYSLLTSFILFNIVHLIYELKDFYFSYIKKYNKRPKYSYNFMELGYHSNNSYQNSIMDQIVSCIGFLFGKFCKDIYDKCS
tara:strand:- start:10022 stop:10393 length:372 start_codon:yes stop_codon:yes gene_type:complete